MSELKVPFAVDCQDKIFSPEQATKGVDYFCPNCNDPLIFRDGGLNVAHFAHKTSLTCSNESITHKAAKMLIKQAVLDWKAGKGACPKVVRVCSGCTKKISQRLPVSIDDVILEYRLPEGFIVDVALMAKGEAVAAVEVKVTHAVDEWKHQQLSISYIEVNGHKIIANSLEWGVINSKLKSNFCTQRCEQAYLKRKEQERIKNEFVSQQRAEAAAHGMVLPEWITYKKAKPIIEKMVFSGSSDDEIEDYINNKYYLSEKIRYYLYEFANDCSIDRWEEEMELFAQRAEAAGMTIEEYMEWEQEQERLKQAQEQEQERLKQVQAQKQQESMELFGSLITKPDEPFESLIDIARKLAMNPSFITQL
jgi:hypothetical protein